MTPREKAKELFDKYVELSGIFVGDYDSEKEMCLIVVNELIEFTYNYTDYNEKSTKEYWNEVKHEIEKL